jgi:hypothetical protein
VKVVKKAPERVLFCLVRPAGRTDVKRTYTRERRMLALGLRPERAWKSSVNGRGRGCNAGCHHLKQALPHGYFQAWELISIRQTVDRLQRIN